MEFDYDIVIIGGGMVGASLACALGRSPYRIGVVEAMAPDAANHASFDDRAIVLAEGSRRIFASLGLWERLVGEATPIEHIHVSDRGHFGATRIHAADEGVAALGQVVEARTIGGVLNDALASLPRAEMLCPARLQAVEPHRDGVRLAIEQEGVARTLCARLAVAADGGASSTRECLEIKPQRAGYGQTAVIANVVTDRSHGGIAYERFTDTGPMALLPFSSSRHVPAEVLPRRWSLVWTAHDSQVDELMGLDDEAFIARLQERFGRRAGRFVAADARSSYPLRLEFLPRPVRERIVFVGNAAHTIHPVAGQGFNLGLRDVAVLERVLRRAGADPGARPVLRRYARTRLPDYLATLGTTDALARVFSSTMTPAVVARDLGMLLLDLAPPLRHVFARRTMGLSGWAG